MNGFLNFMLHFVFIATFSVLYVVSFKILKPLRYHKKRPVSTIALKMSYLLYLLVFLIMTYIVLFFSGVQGNFDDIIWDRRYGIYYIAVIISFIVPNLAIMFRRKIRIFRTTYNYIFTGVNLIIILVLLVIIYNTSWVIR